MSALTLTGIALTLASACTEPEFVVDVDASVGPRRDGGVNAGGLDAGGRTDDDDPPDITVDPIAKQGFPTWGASLSNTRYVMRARVFVHGGDNVPEQHEMIGRVEVTAENTRAVLSIVDICERTIVRLDASKNPPAPVSTSTVAAPWRIEKRSFALRLPEDPGYTFNSGSNTANMSWTGGNCTPGGTECTCPPRDLSAIPETPNDCRVNDLDGDRTPGLQLSVREAAGEAVDQVVLRETLTFVDGKASENSLLSARLIFMGDISTVVCGGKDRTCVKEGWTGCRAANNPVDFVRNPPAEAGTTPLDCDQIRAQLKDGTLFKPDALPFPTTSC